MDRRTTCPICSVTYETTMVGDIEGYKCPKCGYWGGAVNLLDLADKEASEAENE